MQHIVKEIWGLLGVIGKVEAMVLDGSDKYEIIQFLDEARGRLGGIERLVVELARRLG